MHKITPHLWFNKEAKEAAELYVSLFDNSKVTNVTTMKDTPSGDCDVVSFTLAGLPFMAISAGPVFKFNPSASFLVACETKEEVDRLWDKLSVRGSALMELGSYPFSSWYGWTQDRYGVSWQVMLADKHQPKQKITPTLMFTEGVCGKAEEAANFYVEVFSQKGESKVGSAMRYGKGQAPDKEGTVAHMDFTLLSQHFAAMDSAASHGFTFNEAVSLMVPCENQEEIDYYWAKLSAVPEAEQCGWLKDKYGLSWQITPAKLGELMGGDPKQTARVTQAFLKMKKFDIGELERAAKG